MTATAAQLKGDNDTLADLQISNPISQLDDFCDRFMPHRKGPSGRNQPRDQRGIDLTAGHRERSNDRSMIVLEFWLGNLPPFETIDSRAGELSHTARIADPTQEANDFRAAAIAQNAIARLSICKGNSSEGRDQPIPEGDDAGISESFGLADQVIGRRRWHAYIEGHTKATVRELGRT